MLGGGGCGTQGQSADGFTRAVMEGGIDSPATLEPAVEDFRYPPQHSIAAGGGNGDVVHTAGERGEDTLWEVLLQVCSK